MLSEVVRYKPYDDHTAVVIQVEQVKLYARIKQGFDANNRPVGFTLWLSDSPMVHPTEQAAIEAAQRYAERIVLGVVNHATDEDLAAGDRAELRL